MFASAKFIKADYNKPKPYGEGDSAPIFCNSFLYKIQAEQRVFLKICALGIGYAYINGKEVAKDLFCAPVSDYRKTLWYNVYDVTDLLQDGKNIISVIVGNGFYNESFPSAWSFDKAEWRDVPKVILEITEGDKVLLATDDTWRVLKDSFITFNQYRSGEHFDARLYKKGWQIECHKEAKINAVIDDNPPIGRFFEYLASPVQEIEEILPAKFIYLPDGSVTVDFATNMAGYIGINAIGKSGDKITVSYAEEIDEYGNLKLNNLNCYANTVPFQTCEITCGEVPVYYKPKFAYFGFRYAHIKGLEKDLEKYQICAYRVGNTAKRVGYFNCSDGFLNKLHDCAINSVRSNMVYNLTDCPTREKLGWTNDASTSTEHIYYVYKAHDFFKKWMHDIADTMRADGSLSGIAPSPDWGYEHGPVCDFAIFEIAYQDFIFTGSNELLIKYLPQYEKYLEFLKAKEVQNHQFVLADWMGYGNKSTSNQFVLDVLTAHLYEILLNVKSDLSVREDFDKRVACIKSKYINESGRCVENTQTAISMLIYFGYYDQLEPLKNQLEEVIRLAEYHQDVGLLGNKYIWLALDKCNLNCLALKMLKVKGMPSFDFWLTDGATSLYENWEKVGTVSLNHHMYSAVNAFNYKVLGGIRYKKPQKGRPVVEINPYFAEQIDFVDCKTERVNVEWKRVNGKIELSVFVIGDIDVYYNGNKLNIGKNSFVV